MGKENCRADFFKLYKKIQTDENTGNKKNVMEGERQRK